MVRSPRSSAPATPYSKKEPESAGPQNPWELGGKAYRAKRTGPGTAGRDGSGTGTGLLPGRVVPCAAHQLQPGHRLFGTGGVGRLDGEAHVDEHPLARCRDLVEQPDVDAAGSALHLDEGELVAEALHHPDDPAGDPEAHLQTTSVWRSPATTAWTVRTASATAASTSALSPMPSPTSRAWQPTSSVRGGSRPPSDVTVASTVAGSMACASTGAPASGSWLAILTRATVPGAPRSGTASTRTRTSHGSSRS